MQAKSLAAHNFLSLGSFLLTIGLLVWAVLIRDGPVAITIVLLAVATSQFCAASMWQLPSTSKVNSHKVPRGDVPIRTKNGAFVIVQCNEAVARDLYHSTDEVEQLINKGFGICVGTGTVVFMTAVILMAKASWTIQAALAATYLLLNVVYWFVALTPSTTHWEFPSYTIDDVTATAVQTIIPHGTQARSESTSYERIDQHLL